MKDVDVSKPPLQWRIASRVTMTAVGVACKIFMNLGATTQVWGLDGFVRLLESRRDVARRKRGLLTVSNHLSVLDDPVVWGCLPLRILTSPDVMRWSLGSEDICFKNGPRSLLSNFFTYGQTLPCHRSLYSPFGGPYQPTIFQAVRLLSAGPFKGVTPGHPNWSEQIVKNEQGNGSLYSTTGKDEYAAPAFWGSRRFAWVHVFPEGRVHQHPEHGIRYFKWGVARLILESEPCPDVVPMFIEGLKDIMPEDRPDPRWIPAVGKTIGISFGEVVDEETFTGYRERWKKLREKCGLDRQGEDVTEELMNGEEARTLRMEVVKQLREEVEKVRRRRGYQAQDPKSGVAETYAIEGSAGAGEKKDDSLVGTT